ncbi:enoyl-CoA hydratase/isomerase family protein [Rhodoferax ferrireducens]|uniref:enoyl-CoA hydratase/isomerase family protein n=1 Tax=Rhodoferax ferrireducens TaxID=192843 RepID=UPI0018E52297|nr:enoyl-CoA hydratase/isomerase family protein [Rhodoferax ferrireducens]
MSLTSHPVIFEKIGPVGVLTMQYAPHNLVGHDLCSSLLAALERSENSGCRALVLKSGLRHFSAGADLALFEDRGARLDAELNPVGVLDAFSQCRLPIVASVHGMALGGGFELALACDFIIAGASAKFGLVEVTLGLHPLMGGIQRVIDRAGEARGKEIVMLGRRHDAATLEKWGVINRVVPDAQLQESSLLIAQELANGPTVAHGATKRLANVFLASGMHAADAAMKDIQKPIFASTDLVRGLDAFKAAGPGNAVFEGN